MTIYGVYDVWYRTSYNDDYQIDEYFQTKESALAYATSKMGNDYLHTAHIDDWLVEIEVKE
tara:strand:- start:3190 stop:3372 length:183 start_codon:yes stop_codon:yes gene_type:complete